MSAYSQHGYAHFNYYSVGGKLGYDYYNLTLDKYLNGTVNSQSSFNISASGAYYATWLFEFHGDVRFSYRSLNFNWTNPKDPEGLAIQSSSYGIGYFSIPFEARINAVYSNAVKLNFGIGLMPELRLRPHEEVVYQNGSTIVSEDIWQTKGFRVLALGAPLTAELKFYLSKHYTISTSLTYIQYLTNLHKYYFSSKPSALEFRAGFFYEW
jgi:hypothetical protein